MIIFAILFFHRSEEMLYWGDLSFCFLFFLMIQKCEKMVEIFCEIHPENEVGKMSCILSLKLHCSWKTIILSIRKVKTWLMRASKHKLNMDSSKCTSKSMINAIFQAWVKFIQVHDNSFEHAEKNNHKAQAELSLMWAKPSLMWAKPSRMWPKQSPMQAN